MKNLIKCTLYLIFFLNINYSYSQDYFSQINKNDFQVNTNTGNGFYGISLTLDQMSFAKDGSFAISWVSTINGDKDIYARFFDSNWQPLQTEDILVNDDYSGYDQDGCQITRDFNDNIIIIWIDYRNKEQNIYAQFFDPQGNFLGANKNITSDRENVDKDFYAAVLKCNSKNKFLLVWDRGSYYHNCMGHRLLNSDLSPLTAYDEKRTDYYDTNYGEYNSTNANSVDVLQNNNFIFSYYTVSGWDNPTVQLHVCEVDQNIGSVLKTSSSLNSGWDPYTAKIFTNSDSIFTVYSHYRPKSGDELNLRHSFFSKSWNQIGSGVTVENIPFFNIKNDEYIALWGEPENERIVWETTDILGNVKGENVYIPLNPNYIYESTWYSVIAPLFLKNQNNGYRVYWTDNRYDTPDVFYQDLNFSYEPIGQNIRVNNNFTATTQYSPCLALNSNGMFLISWLDDRFENSSSDDNEDKIFSRLYNYKNRPESDDFGYLIVKGNTIFDCGIDGLGNFVIVWPEEKIYIQRFNSDRLRIGDRIKVNMSDGTAKHQAPAIAVTDNGEMLTVWRDGRHAEWYCDIYGQFLDATGRLKGSNFKISDDTQGTNYHYQPSVASANIDGTDLFAIVWEDYRNNNADIYLQLWDATNKLVGKNIKVNKNTDNSSQENPRVAIGKDGKIAVVYEDLQTSSPGIYIQYFNKTGVASGTNLKVSETTGKNQTEPDVTYIDDGKTIVVWTDYRNGENDADIYGQILNGSAKSGTNTKLNNAESSGNQLHPRIECKGDKTVLCWEDERSPEQGTDIFTKIYDPTPPASVDESVTSELVDSYLLQQNYPNPFNSETIIQFKIKEAAPVRLEIYSSNGHLVKTFEYSYQAAGQLNVKWDGRDRHGNTVSSGVYFYKLYVKEYSEMKKMVFIK
jgi:hypothetical protein